MGIRGGNNLSPPLQWSDFPGGTRSFALSMTDLHPEAAMWVHWLVINIPAQTTSLAGGSSPGALPRGSCELFNSFGEKGYCGPQPPAGSGLHRYQITVFALSTENLDVSPYTPYPSLGPVIKEYILSSASLTGTFER